MKNKHSPVEVIRVGVTPYVDTSVQRGISIKGDYLKNFNYGQRVFNYSGISILDIGSPITRYKIGSGGTDDIRNFRFDIGGSLGIHLVTDIRSRLYLQIGCTYTNYSYTDTSDLYNDVSWSGITSNFVAGLEVKPGWLKNYYLHIEYINRKSFLSGEPEVDNPRAHRINTNRFYIGIGKNFNLKAKLRKWRR